MTALHEPAPDALPESNGRTPIRLASRACDLAFFALRSSDLAQEWGYRVEPHLRRLARNCGPALVDAIVQETKRNHAQLWAMWDGERIRAIVVTQIGIAQHSRYCNVWAAVGLLPSREEVRSVARQALAAIEAWARADHGCDWIEVPARTALKNIARGYCRSGDVYRKTLAELH